MNGAPHRPVSVAGPRLLLRELTVADVTPAYVAWMNDPEVTRYLETRFSPQSAEAIREFVGSMAGRSDNVFFAICEHEDERHVGNIKLGPINWTHRHAEVGLLLGDRTRWGLGYATEAIALVRDYAFATLRLRRLTAGCYAPNVGSLRAFQKAGFAIEGRRPGHYLLDGEYVDGLLLGVTAPG